MTLGLSQTVVVPAEPLPYTVTAAGNGAVALMAWGRAKTIAGCMPGLWHRGKSADAPAKPGTH
jgi:hypothetical protein